MNEGHLTFNEEMDIIYNYKKLRIQRKYGIPFHQIEDNLSTLEILYTPVDELYWMNKKTLNLLPKGWIKDDGILNYALKHSLPDGNRKRIVFKNIAFGLLQSNIPHKEVINLAKQIDNKNRDMRGDAYKSIMGWYDWGMRNKATFCGKEVNQYIRQHKLLVKGY